METSNVLDSEFKTLVIRMPNELRGRVDEISEHFNKQIGSIKMGVESIKNNQSEIKNTLTEMKPTLQGIKNGVDKAEDQIRNLEDKEAENIC